MLSDEEWELIDPFLTNYIERIKEYRREHGVSLGEARVQVGCDALEKYFELTGYREENPDALWHHRLSGFGSECVQCGHLLRTPRASFCASCGRKVPRVEIDWAQFDSTDAFYRSVFSQTGAPEVHGRNLDALHDSWVTGGICREGPPFRFTISNERNAPSLPDGFTAEVRSLASASVEAFGGLLESGPGCKLHLVLLPGMDGTGDLFDAFVEAAPQGAENTVVRYPTDEVLTYREYVDLAESHLPDGSPFVLLGESFSGPVAISLAARRPSGLRAVVLCNTFACRPWWRGFRHLPWRLLLGLPAPGLGLGYFLCGFSGMSRYADEIQATNAKVSPAVRESRLREALAVDARSELARLTCPVLYLKGTRDRLILTRSLREITRANPAVRVERFDAPHLLLQMRPGDCWRAITAFIEDTGGHEAPV